MKNRAALAKYFTELGFKKGAEVGVFEGSYSKVLLDTMPNLNLLCVDSWSTDTGWGIRKNSASYPVAVEKLSHYHNATILKGSSVDVAKDILDGSLDFVYIDADHTYESVKADISAWGPKVRAGGIISGHDYFHARNGQVGVVPAVDEYAKEHGLEIKTTDWDNDNPVRDERQPNWYLIKA